CARSFGGFW
nr:immunoglobulin heavy chain junction region [Mus musculus]